MEDRSVAASLDWSESWVPAVGPVISLVEKCCTPFSRVWRTPAPYARSPSVWRTLKQEGWMNQGESCESWLAFLILEPRSPPAISCGFVPCAPPNRIFLQESAFVCRKMHFSAGKCIFRPEIAFFCRKMHFSAGKPIFLQFTPGG